MADQEHSDREEHFSKAVRAGKRTYFFDVKSTRSNDLYLTITESKRRFAKEGEKPFYEKHKIFLYREDFDKFLDGFKEAVQYIGDNAGPLPEAPTESVKSRFADVEYDDLGETPSEGEEPESGDGETKEPS
jgi:hypothetical protein